MTPAAKLASDADEVLTPTPAPTWETADRFAKRLRWEGLPDDFREAQAVLVQRRDGRPSAGHAAALDADDPFTAARALLADLGGAP